MKPRTLMKNYRITAVPLLLVIVSLAVLTAGCLGEEEGAANGQSTEIAYTGSNVEHVELFHFYGSNRCTSCIILGDLAEMTVNTYYAEELESGRLVFSHIDVGVPENREIVERYGPTGSSLWIGIYDENGFHAEELIAPWYLIGSQTRFMGYLKAVIDQQLGQ
ncbi:nitrophenyl compound nitroreductase subunit ArsF family protein [Methanofollis tationis]|uniref:Thioredoxin family protein n=1 Tax=Methanofollis tationis TaxID=81417 RepID=A0A7K4HPZ1_9EURY|nr:nitrophenyl compound nitroreductase subunit ArsF family protein [Methanofollis tationis]NVO67334.1 thioredoxin family protein [Methanofollis tationis]